MKLLESRKEEDAAAGSGQAVASGEDAFCRVSAFYHVLVLCPLYSAFTKCNEKLNLVIVFGLLASVLLKVVSVMWPYSPTLDSMKTNCPLR